MNTIQGRFKNTAIWITILCAIALIAVPWSMTLLQPLAISDTLVVTARSHNGPDAYNAIASIVRGSMMKQSTIITAISLLIIALNVTLLIHQATNRGSCPPRT